MTSPSSVPLIAAWFNYINRVADALVLGNSVTAIVEIIAKCVKMGSVQRHAPKQRSSAPD